MFWKKNKAQKDDGKHVDDPHRPSLPRAALRETSPELPPKDPPLYEMVGNPWRKLDWGDRKKMKSKLRTFEVSTPAVKSLRILIHGPVGAGKSTFINSIDSIFQERMTSGAIADATSDFSFTKIFQTHNIRDQGYKAFLPFAFCDIMGLEDGHCKGAETEDLKNILKGHIKDGFTFNPTSPCEPTDRHYNSNPTLGDKIHCLVSVISAQHVNIIQDPLFDKMKEIRAQAAKLNIPQVTVMTKVDETCPEVKKDLTHIYKSKRIKEQMTKCSHKLGMPLNCIFPVKNYSEEIHLNDEVDVLLLSALETILNFANDYVAKKIDEERDGPGKFEEHTHHQPQARQGYGEPPPYENTR